MARKLTRREQRGPKGFSLESYQIVVRPIITEKGTHLVERHNTYAFEVHPQATKDEIKKAVEDLFDVHVIDVRTQNRNGKPRRYRTRMGRTAEWKKAYVKLSEADRIQLF